MNGNTIDYGTRPHSYLEHHPRPGGLVVRAQPSPAASPWGASDEPVQRGLIVLAIAIPVIIGGAIGLSFVPWMSWTLPSGIFFIVIATALAVSLFELWKPTIERRGFLPMPTTRGDRFFLGLVGSGILHWSLSARFGLWIASIASVIWFIAVMRWG